MCRLCVFCKCPRILFKGLIDPLCMYTVSGHMRDVRVTYVVICLCAL